MEGYYKTPASVEEYIKMAAGYDGRELIDQLKQYLTPGASVLEIGMGPGKDLDILQDHYHATGSDFSKVFLARYLSKNPQADLLQLNAVDLDTEKKFDCLYSNKVLHHLSNNELKGSIKNQHRILRDFGLVCHSFWKGKGEESISGLLFNYHTVKDLTELFASNFDILKMDMYMEFEEDDSILLIGRKK